MRVPFLVFFLDFVLPAFRTESTSASARALSNAGFIAIFSLWTISPDSTRDLPLLVRSTQTSSQFALTARMSSAIVSPEINGITRSSDITFRSSHRSDGKVPRAWARSCSLSPRSALPSIFISTKGASSIESSRRSAATFSTLQANTLRVSMASA